MLAYIGDRLENYLKLQQSLSRVLICCKGEQRSVILLQKSIFDSFIFIIFQVIYNSLTEYMNLLFFIWAVLFPLLLLLLHTAVDQVGISGVQYERKTSKENSKRLLVSIQLSESLCRLMQPKKGNLFWPCT